MSLNDKMESRSIKFWGLEDLGKVKCIKLNIKEKAVYLISENKEKLVGFEFDDDEFRVTALVITNHISISELAEKDLIEINYDFGVVQELKTSLLGAKIKFSNLEIRFGVEQIIKGLDLSASNYRLTWVL